MSIHLPCQLGSRARLAVLYALRVHRGGLSPDQLIRQTQLHPQTLSQALYGLHADMRIELRAYGGVHVWRIPTRFLEAIRWPTLP